MPAPPEWDLQKGKADTSMLTLTLGKLELDKVCKDKKDKLVSKDFGVCLHLRSMEEMEPAEVNRRRSVLTAC